MPKKLNSNPKAVEARERKETVKKEKTAAATKAADDAKWADEGQSAAERRAAEKEKKRLEELKKKEQKKVSSQSQERLRAPYSRTQQCTQPQRHSLCISSAVLPAQAATVRDEEDMKAVKTVKVNPHKVSSNLTAHTHTPSTPSTPSTQQSSGRSTHSSFFLCRAWCGVVSSGDDRCHPVDLGQSREREGEGAGGGGGAEAEAAVTGRPAH